MSREILDCLASYSQGSPAFILFVENIVFSQCCDKGFDVLSCCGGVDFVFRERLVHHFVNGCFLLEQCPKECGAVVECNHTVKTVACCSDRNDYFASCDISQSKSFFDFHQPLSPLSCLSISSITISYISPSVLQYCKTSHGSLV